MTRFSGCVLAALLLCLAATPVRGEGVPPRIRASAAGGAAVANAPEEIEVYLVLEGKPAVRAALDAKGLPAADQRAIVKDRLDAIEKQHNDLVPELRRMGARETYRFRRTVNAIQVRVPSNELLNMAALPGVVRVEPVPEYIRNTDSSVAFMGTPAVWNPAGLNARGEGVRIGIIDTGIDYYHANFGGSGNPADYEADDSAIVETGTFPTARVVGGHDFCGDNYNSGSSNPDINTPFPDPDPLDCGGHGTHVAGIAAGNGVLSDGSVYTGPWPPAIDPSEFLVAPGVAPEASLYALKVFGCSGSTRLAGAALEWAADPNDDGDFSDRLDVVNLSLGSSFGSLYETENEIVRNLTELGCVVVGSAGNSGNTFFIAGGVGLMPEAISVAAIMDDGLVYTSLVVDGPPGIAGEYTAAEALFTPQLAGIGPISGELAMASPALGCDTLTNPGEISGRIALIDRGSCNFATKILNAQNAGAIAAVVVNNVEGIPTNMTGSADGITIPAVMISIADGDLLKAHLAEGVEVTLPATSVVRPDFAREAVSFTSRGPVIASYYLKPDIAAPGASISSAATGTGTDATKLSGTSMSAPHVAGAAALLRELFPAESVATLKARLMNTAEGSKTGNDPSPESRTGIGSMRIDKAAAVPAIAVNAAQPARVSISWGLLPLTDTYTNTQDIQITNLTDTPQTWTVTAQNTVAQGGVSVTPLQAQVMVPALGSANVGVRLDADPAQFDRTVDPTTTTQSRQPRASLYESSGYIRFDNGNGVELRTPYHAAVEARAQRSAPSTIVTTPVGAVTAQSIPLSGASAHSAPLTSVFHLGHAGESAQHTDPFQAAVDLLAVGMTSDHRNTVSFSEARLYFGIAVDGQWTAPRSWFGEFDVWIDVGADGSYEYILYNSDYGLETAGTSTDAFVTTRYNRSPQTRNIEGRLNVLSPQDHDLALFNNSVIIMSVPVASIGLTEANPVIRYAVYTFDRNGNNVDNTPEILFDLRTQPIDGTAHGIMGTPLQPASGSALTVNVHNALLESNPDARRALLLHHHNATGQQVQIVEFLPGVAGDAGIGWMLY